MQPSMVMSNQLSSTAMSEIDLYKHVYTRLPQSSLVSYASSQCARGLTFENYAVYAIRDAFDCDLICATGAADACGGGSASSSAVSAGCRGMKNRNRSAIFSRAIILHPLFRSAERNLSANWG
jgi:hypothetical protein